MAIINPALFDLPERLVLAQEGLATSEAGVRCRMDWGGLLDIPVVGSAEEDFEKLTPGGTVMVRKVTISVRTVSLPPGVGHPKRQHLIGYRCAINAETVTYRIVGVKNSWNVWLELQCESPHAGA